MSGLSGGGPCCRTTLNNEPPGLNSLEVSIFGPGKGESVVVHLGANKWIIVDSCVDASDDTLPAVRYLKSIGVSVENDVLMVLGTHAHDDHIVGISRVLDECKSAFYACSSALVQEDFAAVLEEDLQAELGLRKSSYSEFRKVNDITNERRIAANGKRFMKRAVEDLPLLDLQINSGLCRVTALSPSHEAVTRMIHKLAGANVVIAGKPRRPFRGDPNESSVALWIESLGHRVLLGADLLKGPSGCGWSGILTEFSPVERASLFKVPHHGAPNADEEMVWQKLLIPDPVALLAPYRAGRNPRPNRTDIERISQRTSQAFITASPDVRASRSRVKKQKVAFGNLAMNVRQTGKVGQVRARIQLGESKWNIELLAPAQELSSAGRSTRGRNS